MDVFFCTAVGAGATTAPAYDYGYTRPAASYETPKTYYQQPATATYSTSEYQQGKTISNIYYCNFYQLMKRKKK